MIKDCSIPEESDVSNDLSSTVRFSKNQCRDHRWFFDVNITAAKSHIFLFICFTRVFVAILQIIFNQWNFTTDAFRGISIPADELTFLDRLIIRSFGGFYRWDSVHMIHIAEYGYVLENSLAFFPLFPHVINVCSLWAYPLLHYGLMHASCAYLLTSVVFNSICFSISSRLLFFIVHTVSRSIKEAFLAVVIFGFNPASVFFSAAYTESLYCTLTFAGIAVFLGVLDEWELTKVFGRSFLTRYLLGIICFTLSYATRSNGLINLGYVGFFCGLNFLFRSDAAGGKVFSWRPGTATVITKISTLCMQLILALLMFSCPMYYYGSFQQKMFCSQNSLSFVSNSLAELARISIVPTIGQPELLQWCNVSTGLSVFPVFYSSIQAKYWDVSLFGYWQISKIPCFMLAAPALFIVVFGVRQTLNELRKRNLLEVLADGGDHIPYAIHAVVMALGAVFFYNVEVFTRMLFSSSPFPYLVLARWMSAAAPRARLSDCLAPSHLPFLSVFCWRRGWAAVLFFYLVGYTVFGTAMHSMGLPFT